MSEIMRWALAFIRFILHLPDGEYMISLHKQGEESSWRILEPGKEMRA